MSNGVIYIRYRFVASTEDLGSDSEIVLQPDVIQFWKYRFDFLRFAQSWTHQELIGFLSITQDPDKPITYNDEALDFWWRHTTYAIDKHAYTPERNILIREKMDQLPEDEREFYPEFEEDSNQNQV